MIDRRALIDRVSDLTIPLVLTERERIEIAVMLRQGAEARDELEHMLALPPSAAIEALIADLRKGQHWQILGQGRVSNAIETGRACQQAADLLQRLDRLSALLARRLRIQLNRELRNP